MNLISTRKCKRFGQTNKSISWLCLSSYILFNLNDRIAMNNYDASEWHSPESSYTCIAVYLCVYLLSHARTHAPLNENIYSFSSPSPSLFLCMSFSSRKINKKTECVGIREQRITLIIPSKMMKYLFFAVSRVFGAKCIRMHHHIDTHSHFTDRPMARVRFDNRDFPQLRLTHWLNPAHGNLDNLFLDVIFWRFASVFMYFHVRRNRFSIANDVDASHQSRHSPQNTFRLIDLASIPNHRMSIFLYEIEIELNNYCRIYFKSMTGKQNETPWTRNVAVITPKLLQ